MAGPVGKLGPVGKFVDSATEWKPKFDAKYAELGGAGGFLGSQKTDLVSADSNDPADNKQVGWVQTFEHGALCGNFKAREVFELHGAIYEKWVAVGGPKYGLPTTDESAAPGKGRVNFFAPNQSAIYWSPETGAHAVYGGIQARWNELGGAGGKLGYATTDEIDNVDNARTDRHDRCQRFTGGYISWSTETGAHEHFNGAVSSLSVAHLNIHSIRSRHRDTNVLGMFASAPGQPEVNFHEGLGDFGVGDFDINKTIQFIADDPTAVVNVSWALVNHEKGDTKEMEDQLHKALKTVAEEGADKLGAAIGAAIGGVFGVIGAAIGALLGYLAGLGLGDIFVSCDGLVAADTVFVSAATWNDTVAHGPKVIKKDYQGQPSPDGCGDDSNYEVTWKLN